MIDSKEKSAKTGLDADDLLLEYKKSGKKEHFLLVFHFLLFLAIHSNNALRKGKKQSNRWKKGVKF